LQANFSMSKSSLGKTERKTCDHWKTMGNWYLFISARYFMEHGHCKNYSVKIMVWFQLSGIWDGNCEWFLLMKFIPSSRPVSSYSTPPNYSFSIVSQLLCTSNINGNHWNISTIGFSSYFGWGFTDFGESLGISTIGLAGDFQWFPEILGPSNYGHLLPRHRVEWIESARQVAVAEPHALLPWPAARTRDELVGLDPWINESWVRMV
jgi:hypothetical protein